MRNWLKRHPHIRLLLCAALLEFVLETLFRHTPVKAVLFVCQRPHIFLLNVLIVFATYSVCAPFRKRFAIVATVTLLWLTFGVVNFVISLYRSLPFTIVDLLLVKDMFSLLGVYFNAFQIILMFAALIGVVAAIALLFIRSKSQDRLPWSQWIPSLAAPSLLALTLCVLGVRAGILDFQFANLSNSYKENGFAYCFVCTFADVGMRQPDSYSPETITELDEAVFDPNGSDGEAEELPNIVYLQLESFFDLTQVIDSGLDCDPAPNYTRLKAECPSGYLYVPVSGGGTVNTELEILTGMNIDFFGAGEYPYYTVLRDSCCESIAYDLADLGYTATAVHNNSGSFYSRNEVYSRLGFDRFDSVEYIPGITRNPIGWANDDVLVDEILLALDSTPRQDLVFTVAVQTHGAYPNEPDNQRSLLDLGAGEEGINEYTLAYYADQVAQVDATLGRLVDALAAYDEPVVLIAYGDHLPAMNLTNELLTTGDLFTSEYFIWANFGLKGWDEDLEAYQLTAHALDMLDLHCGTMFCFHQNWQNAESYLDDMHLLQYDMLYGDHSIYGGEMPYEQTDLKMGLREITLEQARMQYGYLSVTGANFTPYSRVCVNGEMQETLFISDSQLVVAGFSPAGDETVFVGQVSDDQIILSQTESLPISPE